MKMLIIGIDGLDPILLETWKDELPNFKELKGTGVEIKLKSVYPVDSVPIWSSLYTGLTPANHGILDSTDYLDKNFSQNQVDVSSFRGKTFWDIASKHGKGVCVINPFLAFPAWKVNGVMASGPPFHTGKRKVSVYPQSVLENYEVPHLGGVLKSYPPRNKLREFHEKMKKITSDEANFGLKILKDYYWDLGFVCLITLDGIEHFFWRYFDKNDPTYPGDGSYKNVVKDFYRLYDRIVGEYMKLDYDVLIVLSDHGHGMRNTKLVNINEILRREKYLKTKTSIHISPSYLVGTIKHKLLDFIYEHNLDDLSLKLARTMPKVSKKIQKSSFSIDFEDSSAYVSDIHGMNPGGGIEINTKNLNINYEKLRTEIIKEIYELKDPNTDERIVKWICRREDLYTGKYISKFPDIVFELKSAYGVNWDVHVPIITNCYAHKIISGGHKRDAVFIIKGVDKKIVGNNMTSTDIAPTILNLLHIKGDFNFDGRTLFNMEQRK